MGQDSFQKNTTTQMILEDGAQTLMEAGTKSNRLLKCWAINGGGHFYLRRRSRFTEAVKIQPSRKIDLWRWSRFMQMLI